MTEPKRKISKSKGASRRAHQGYSTPNLAECPQCHSPKPSHKVCPVCGTYRGREIYKVKTKG